MRRSSSALEPQKKSHNGPKLPTIGTEEETKAEKHNKGTDDVHFTLTKDLSIDCSETAMVILSENPDNNALLIEKSFKLTNFQQDDIEIIKHKAIAFALEFRTLNDRVIVKGSQGAVLEFLNWLYEFLNTCLTLKEQDFSHEEVSINTFHRIYKDKIQQRAEDLYVKCDFRYNIILMTGRTIDLKELKSYLHEVETNAKKELYPKYWDLKEQRIYSEIEVAPECDEFQEVSSLMAKSLPNTKIEKLIRIQNNFLMAHYLTNMNMRREVRGLQINRQFLFHGTTINPRNICRILMQDSICSMQTLEAMGKDYTSHKTPLILMVLHTKLQIATVRYFWLM